MMSRIKSGPIWGNSAKFWNIGDDSKQFQGICSGAAAIQRKLGVNFDDLVTIWASFER